MRAGLRLDYFDARSDAARATSPTRRTPSRAPRRPPDVPTTAKTTLSPRLGVSYPIATRAALHFAYGHFEQYPGARRRSSRTPTTAARRPAGRRASSSASWATPTSSPSRPCSTSSATSRRSPTELGVDVTMFYKDIRDLLGVEFISTYNDAEYARLTNVDFGNVLGLHRGARPARRRPVHDRARLHLAAAQGNSSDPRETATARRSRRGPAAAPHPVQLGPAPHAQPDADACAARAYSVSAILSRGERPAVHAGARDRLRRRARGELGPQARRRRWSTCAARRRSRSAGRRGQPLRPRLQPVRHARSSTAFVFASTGSPYYSRFPEADSVALARSDALLPAAPDRARARRLGAEGRR